MKIEGLLYFAKRNQNKTKPKRNETEPTVLCETKRNEAKKVTGVQNLTTGKLLWPLEFFPNNSGYRDLTPLKSLKRNKDKK